MDRVITCFSDVNVLVVVCEGDYRLERILNYDLPFALVGADALAVVPVTDGIFCSVCDPVDTRVRVLGFLERVCDRNAFCDFAVNSILEVCTVICVGEACFESESAVSNDVTDGTVAVADEDGAYCGFSLESALINTGVGDCVLADGGNVNAAKSVGA